MSEAPRKWDDLTTRIWTAIGLVLIGGGAIVIGGWPLLLVLAIACAAMFWELVRMISPAQAQLAAGFAAAGAFALLSLALPVNYFIVGAILLGAGTLVIQAHKLTFLLYGAVILLGCFSLMFLRAVYPPFVLWLVAVVVATDILGYVFGRLLGGPKFWPRISPKKTWSGTVGGWIGAALVGYAMVPMLGAAVIPVSVLVSFASQMGDIAESAIKRRAGVKDSSNLLPGHGGFLDRFDGMIAAFALWLVAAPFLLAVPVAG